MHPFTVYKIERHGGKDSFNLEHALIWMPLPPLHQLPDKDAADILRSSTVLEDTLIVPRLPVWRKSPTKRLLNHPKMYFFDNGVTNALRHRLHSVVDPTLKGRLFEQFMIQETNRMLDYSGFDYALYYWRTNHGAEVDLLIEINGRLNKAVEFKSTSVVGRGEISGLASFHEDNPSVECYIVRFVPGILNDPELIRVDDKAKRSRLFDLIGPVKKNSPVSKTTESSDPRV